MATIPNPRTWGLTESATAAKFNADIRDSFRFLYNPPRARLIKSVDQSCANNVVSAITWENEEYDTDNGHSTSTNTNRYTAQTAGWYYIAVCLYVTVTTQAQVGTREVCLRKNGSDVTKQSRQDHYLGPGDRNRHAMRTSGHMFLSVNDYVEVLLHQDSGGVVFVRNFSGQPSRFTIRWVRS